MARNINFIEINSPAKINFGLNIINKREDGFHDIETIFYPIDLVDKLYFEKSDAFSFAHNSTELLAESEDNNLIIKALGLLEKYSGKKLKVRIKLDKQIPMGAGLGGGSSNAAHTLLCLNEMFQLAIPEYEIRALALKLGSDVPFFIRPIPSFAHGRGEIIKPIEFEIPKTILLVNPRIHVPTPWAYKNCTPKQPEFSLLSLDKVEITDFSKLKTKVVNNFEDIVFSKFPEIAKVKEKMYSCGAKFSLMSGSGSSVFGLFENDKAALDASLEFPVNYFSTLV